MGKIRRSLFVLLSFILLNDFVLSATVEKQSAEKRTDEDSYIDALHKTHADDSLHCECKKLNWDFVFYFFVWF